MIDKKKTTMFLSMVAILAVISGVVLTALAATEQGTTTIGQNTTLLEPNGMCGMGREGRGYGPIQVSEEFKANVVSIVEKDSDVQGLLDKGYNVTGIRPLITSTVNGDGTVTTKATGAIVMLENQDMTSHAAALIDLSTQSVTRIEIITRTVIDKSQTSTITTSIGA